MPGLLDIAPSSKTVPIQGVDVAVHGVSAEGIAYMLERFPVVRELMAGRDVNLDASALFKLAPQAVASIIAAGCGYPNNPEAEAKAAQLGAEDQLTLLDAIVKLTMPNGVGPFADKLMAMLEGMANIKPGGFGKAPDMKSPSPSKDS